MANVVEQKESQQNLVQTNSYVTVIPVEYPSNRGVYNGQTPEYIVEQFRYTRSSFFYDRNAEHVFKNLHGFLIVKM